MTCPAGCACCASGRLSSGIHGPHPVLPGRCWLQPHGSAWGRKLLEAEVWNTWAVSAAHLDVALDGVIAALVCQCQICLRQKRTGCGILICVYCCCDAVSHGTMAALLNRHQKRWCGMMRCVHCCWHLGRHGSMEVLKGRRQKSGWCAIHEMYPSFA